MGLIAFSVTNYCVFDPDHDTSETETEKPVEMVDEVTGKPVEDEDPDKGTLFLILNLLLTREF